MSDPAPVPPARVCVFCGSADGARPAYAAAATELGAALAAAGVGLVYGGASVGLMGRTADAALAGGGQVEGVIPRVLMDREIAHPGLSVLHEVETMHERKARMAQRSDAFVVLPGGLGTLEELFEIVTWRQLGIHAKPTVMVDVEGYWSGLRAFLDHGVQQGFVQAAQRDALGWSPDVPGALMLLGLPPG